MQVILEMVTQLQKSDRNTCLHVRETATHLGHQRQSGFELRGLSASQQRQMSLWTDSELLGSKTLLSKVLVNLFCLQIIFPFLSNPVCYPDSIVTLCSISVWWHKYRSTLIFFSLLLTCLLHLGHNRFSVVCLWRVWNCTLNRFVLSCCVCVCVLLVVCALPQARVCLHIFFKSRDLILYRMFPRLKCFI